MNRIPHGYTYSEVLIAVALVFCGVILILAMASPITQYRRAQDEIRAQDVQNILEVMLEMQYTEPETFAGIIGTIAGGRTMIGESTLCAGNFGSMCSGSDIQDHCVNLSKAGALKYIASLPIDAKTQVYTNNQTGYYLELKDQTLIVGACNPRAQEKIELEASLK
ncbi:hypothetical protein COY25_03015 [Candidatus Uhrbacteria bacterium CG_4_10_14_0_2_um_filter_41_7]|uniref:Type II secretion system protein n=1 Tax=Candidatus Uhrbacteria bacterium CG_4_9_14_3_um_filter_41_35 TaxID=1975034 RepID=A0A2M7XEE1_9BACT|nr:MAG: hypothetical protein COV92_00355 [Candidatus Uhrbacteria bacterium CG11_big_fil_rev_8_21_14_0_20_41_9]PIZ53773.1 MAG: hypothetical protein COY25_03015 [Candidatus Uhrbacteria bacterium CG_4_10_14_0_2_um_filter_41_7]PJA46076.1 MAG: hypothetical protein CO173_03815 [Candidatus Uhrbacteria bacterium CG_4_9_14_3_um_filter_41_35]